MDEFMLLAVAEAKKAQGEGGPPYGSVLVRDGRVLSKGHNRTIQQNDPTSHAEIEAIRNAGLLETYAGTVMYASAFPCLMCAGAVVRLGIPKIVVGATWPGYESSREFMLAHGVKLVILELEECRALIS